MATATIHVQGTFFDKLKWYFVNHKQTLYLVVAFIAVFLVIGLIVNPIYAGNPLQGEVRSKSVDDFNASHGGVYLQVSFNATVPEGDGLGGVTYTTAIKTARIPLVVDRIDPFQDEQDSGKQMVFNYITGGATSVLLGEMDDASGMNLWNPMENLIYAQDTYLTSLLGAQVYPTNMSRVFWKDDYKGVTVFTPFENRPLLVDENWHYSERYTATVPSPAQFAYMICQSSGWTLNNVTDARTQLLLGTGGTRPNYEIENFGVPCDIDNDTSDYIIDMVPTAEADRMMADGSLPAMGYISAQDDYHSYYVQMYDEEKDAFTNGLFLGSFLISGMVPHTYSTCQAMNGRKLYEAVGQYYAFKMAEAEGDMKKEGNMAIQTDYIDTGSLLFGLILSLVAKVNYDAGYTRGLAEGYDEGYQAGVDAATADFTLLLYNMSSELNMSQQQLQAALDEVTRINTNLKLNIDNPYNKSGIIAPDIPTPFNMPSSLSIVVVLVITIVIGIVIIVIVIYFVLKRRKKKGEQEVPEGVKPVKRQEQSTIARASSLARSVIRK